MKMDKKLSPHDGLCPWTPLGFCTQTLVKGSRSTLAMVYPLENPGSAAVT